MVKYGQTRASVTDSAEHTDLGGVQAKKVHLFGRDSANALNDIYVDADGNLGINRSNTIQNTTTISNSASETTILSAVASKYLDLTLLKIANTSATGLRVDIRDATGGTIRDSWWIPANDTRGMALSRPWTQTAQNNNWTAQCSASVVDVRISTQAIKNS